MEFTKHKMWAAVGTAVAIAVLTAFQTVFGDGKLTLEETITVILAGVGAYAVYRIPNQPVSTTR